MKTVLHIIALIAEFQLTLVGLLWVMAFLGFADEAHGRAALANWLGKGTAVAAVLIATLPLLVTLWTAWRRFFSNSPWDDVKFGICLPLVVLVVCGLICPALIYLFNAFGYSPRS